MTRDVGPGALGAEGSAAGRDLLAETVLVLLAEWLPVPEGPVSDRQDGLVAPADWANATLPDFLMAMIAWLGSYEQAYAERGLEPPTDAWEVVCQALRGSARYVSGAPPIHGP